jgi:hypothetical protein
MFDTNDQFRAYLDTVVAPARQIFTIAPSDSAEIVPLPKAVRAVGAGTIMLQAVDSSIDVAHPVYDGEVIEGRIRFIRATGTNVAVIGYA